ncbi:MAG: ADP-ribosylglycohydrolase family protein [Patescibacteria group bacterium]
MPPTTLSKVQGTFLGCAIGDAMGMPVETMMHEEILAITDAKGVVGFMDAKQRNLKSISNYKAGDTTDDWQLTAAIVRSLIRMRCYKFEDTVNEQVKEFERCQNGWGRSTKSAFREIKEWFDSEGERGRASWQPALAKEGSLGCGNGVAMKIAAIALHSCLDCVHPGNIADQIMEQGRLTHPDTRASHAAYAVAWLLTNIFMRPLHTGIFGKEDVEKMLFLLILEVERIERLFPDPQMAEDRISSRLRKIFHGKMLDNATDLRVKNGTSCFSLESIPFSMATFLRHPTDFRAGVLEAVNAGGDTDSNAAMVGALIGANCGVEAIPEEWRNFRKEFEEPVRLGEEFHRVFFSIR